MDILKVFVKLTFYPKEIIGRDRKYYDKYRPAFKIRGDMFNSGQIEFIDKIEVNSGEIDVKAYIIFPNKQLLSNNIYIGKSFTFGEGSKILGEGTIIDI